MAKNRKGKTPSSASAPTHAPGEGALRRELEKVEHALAYGPSGLGWKHSKPEKRAELAARAAELRFALKGETK